MDFPQVRGRWAVGPEKAIEVFEGAVPVVLCCVGAAGKVVVEGIGAVEDREGFVVDLFAGSEDGGGDCVGKARWPGVLLARGEN